jgi:dTDP-4-dehydrorhamnose reductase
LAQVMMDIVTAQEWILGFIIIRMREISWYEFVLAIQEIGEYLRSEGYPSSSYPTLQKRVRFLYWIKPRLKEYMVLAFHYKDSLKKMFRVLKLFKYLN